MPPPRWLAFNMLNLSCMRIPVAAQAISVAVIFTASFYFLHLSGCDRVEEKPADPETLTGSGNEGYRKPGNYISGLEAIEQSMKTQDMPPLQRKALLDTIERMKGESEIARYRAKVEVKQQQAAEQ